MKPKIWKPETCDLPEDRKFAAFDTEDDGLGNMHFGCLLTESGEEFRFEDPEEFMGICEHLGSGYDIWAHNLEYDAGNVLTPFLKQCRPLVGGHGKIIGIDLNKGPRFRDSFLHWFCSLKKLGDTVGLEKLDADFEDEAVKAAFTRGEKWCYDYCKRDVEITLKAMLQSRAWYRKTNTRMRATVGGSSLSRFDRNYLDRPQPLPPWLRFIRESYYGGRTEVFRLWDLSDVHSADLNSAYPSVMQSEQFPDTSTAEDVPKFRLDWEGVCFAVVKIPPMHIPPLPVRTKAGNVYPIGKIRGYWTAPELRYAASLGCKVETFKGLRFRESFRPFKNMILYHYPHKQAAAKKGDKVTADFHKRAMNSLYGMFGLSGERWTYAKAKKTGETSIRWGRGHLVIRKNAAPFANQIWSSYITSYVRILLHKALAKVEANGGRVVYCDTDSIYYQGEQIWTGCDQLGALNHEGTESGYFVAPKTYSYGQTITAKGIPRPTLAIIHGLGAATMKTPLRLLQALKVDRAPNVWAETTRTVSGVFTRREDHADGSTSPLTLSMNP